MRIVAVTRILNEEDIIEPLVRHHAALVDHHIVLDNGSTDRTLEILRSLTCEGMPLTVLQCESSIFSETQFNTWLYARAVGGHAADWVVFLDADEFIDARRIGGDLRSYLGAVPAQFISIGVELVNYDAPSPETDGDINVVRRLSRRIRGPIGVWKVFVRGSLAPERVVVDAGNHFIRIDGHFAEPARQSDFTLAHYPNRSPFHFAGKAVTGRLKVLAAGQRELRQGRAGHYNDPFERLKAAPGAWLHAALGGFAAMQTAADLVDDPIDYLGADLLYTLKVDYAWRALALTLTAMERIASAYGAAIDAHPGVRAEVDDHLGQISVVSEALPAAAARAAYGSILGATWRAATDPGFMALLGEGWSIPEAWGGVWGVGAAHAVRLFYPAAPHDHVDIEADVDAAMPGTRERQDVDVFAAAQFLTSWVFTRAENRGVRSVRIPAALIAANLPLLTLTFCPRLVEAPSEVEPGHPDDRQLGMAVHKLRQIVL
jgi:glycosyltransferase involved in cell wall biosynthesis